MEIIEVEQGSKAWHEHRRTHKNASDAPAALGESPYKSRDEFIAERATGITKPVDAATQRRFDDGHRHEALARPIAEQIIGEDLYPVTGSEGEYSASFDGLTMDERIGFEHKRLNAELRQIMPDSGLNSGVVLPLLYTIQMEQQCMVSGAEKILFMASEFDDNDQLVDERHCWYTPDPELRQRIIDGWALFDKDVANYVAPEAKAVIEETVVEAFPVPAITVRGELVASNLSEITPRFDSYLDELKTELVTDQDFADGDVNAKHCRETAKKLSMMAESVIGQISSINDVVKMLELYAEKFNAKGLALEKKVKEGKDTIKAKAISEAINKFRSHVSALQSEITGVRLTVNEPNFAEAIKGLRTLDSMHTRINETLANAKLDADAQARDIRAKLAWCKENADGYGFLFADLQQIISKPMDDFQLVVKTRIADHKQAIEDKRIADEQAEAQRMATLAAQQTAQAVTTRVEVPAVQEIPDGDCIKPDIPTQGAASTLGLVTSKPADNGIRLKLGDINQQLGFLVTADFLKSLGHDPVGTDGRAILYRQADFGLICESIMRHVVKVVTDFNMKEAA